jgi:hypothetical protein
LHLPASPAPHLRARDCDELVIKLSIRLRFGEEMPTQFIRLGLYEYSVTPIYYSVFMTYIFEEREAQVRLHHNGEWVGYVSYDIDLMETDYITIGWVKSFIEGKGYARILMEWLYNRYPEHMVDWGECLHPASLALAEDFYSRYYDRTAYLEPMEIS